MKNLKGYIISAIVALLLILGVNAVKPQQSSLSGLSERDVQVVSLAIGTNPATGQVATKAVKHLFGICNAAITTLPLAATSTEAHTCSASGVRSGDNVRITLPSDNALATGIGGLVLTYQTASTNSITFGVLNLSGAATSTYPLATTSVMWEAWDN